MDVNNKVNFFCRSVQVQRLGTKLEPRGSDTLEFHYAAVRVVCVCVVCVCAYVLKEPQQVGSDFQERVTTVAAVALKPAVEQMMPDTSIFVQAAQGLRKRWEYSRHKGLIHGLCTITLPPPPPSTQKEGGAHGHRRERVFSRAGREEELSIRSSSIHQSIHAPPQSQQKKKRFISLFHCYLQERCGRNHVSRVVSKPPQ